MKKDESKRSETDLHEMKRLDPARFEGAATPCSEDPNHPKLVASAWRVLNEPYAFPDEAEYRAAAAKDGCEVTRSVQPEDGGYRYELKLGSPVPETDPDSVDPVE